jgi:heparan-alpha-glucosaminide N-acetyltransferase
MVSRRLASVDALRAITMLLMIFVNDLVSLKDVPAWLEHAEEMEDRMGLADVVFPAFLFIVGLSIPFAIANRAAKGYSRKSTLIHILNRSLALLVMGIYSVNYENYVREGAFIPKYWWLLLSTIAFFLVWLDYPKEMSKAWRRWLQWTGIILLAFLAFIYKGQDHGHTIWLRTHWYGILGLIGWCYVICACLYLWRKDRQPLLWLSFFFFIGLCIADKMGLLVVLKPMRNFFWIVGSGSLPALTMGGVLAAIIYRNGVDKGRPAKSLLILLVFAALAMAAGFALRPYWGISKLRNTPAWILITMGITLIAFVVLAWLMDLKGRREWYKVIKPAGTSTLTCYLLPNIHFAIYHLMGDQWRLPATLRTDGMGIVKSIIYALLIVLLTGVLERKKFRLSI